MLQTLQVGGDPHVLQPGADREAMVKGQPNQCAHLTGTKVVPHPCDDLRDEGVL
jgi:hypothetical protein